GEDGRPVCKKRKVSSECRGTVCSKPTPRVGPKEVSNRGRKRKAQSDPEAPRKRQKPEPVTVPHNVFSFPELRPSITQRCVPMEMVLMAMTPGDSVGGNAVVSPLAWTDLDYEVLLIMERPENCMNLFDYNNGQIDERLAKEFMRQLVEAAIQIHKAGEFHGDLKPENILIQFYDAWRIPRVRVIDFGCGWFVMPGYRGYVEFNHQESYEAGPTTVWQLGCILLQLLNCKTFLKKNCLYFISMCCTICFCFLLWSGLEVRNGRMFRKWNKDKQSVDPSLT
uniref:non-specific serine/threonine protein kinase n=1 Tax=Takifugu rubripes TaxID=31033 RepID=A0A674PRN5_TAKRU